MCKSILTFCLGTLFLLGNVAGAVSQPQLSESILRTLKELRALNRGWARDGTFTSLAIIEKDLEKSQGKGQSPAETRRLLTHLRDRSEDIYESLNKEMPALVRNDPKLPEIGSRRWLLKNALVNAKIAQILGENPDLGWIFVAEQDNPKIGCLVRLGSGKTGAVEYTEAWYVFESEERECRQIQRLVARTTPGPDYELCGPQMTLSRPIHFRRSGDRLAGLGQYRFMVSWCSKLVCGYVIEDGVEGTVEPVK